MINKYKSKYVISYAFLLDSLFFLTLLMSVIAAHTILDDIFKMMFIAGIFLYSLKRLYKFINLYFILEFVFITYSYWQIKNNIAVNLIVSRERIVTLIISLIYYIAVYIYIIQRKNNGQVIKQVVNAIFYGLFIVLICEYKNISAGRIGSGNGGISILGLIIGNLNSTYIGQLAGITLFLGVLLYWKNNKKKALFYVAFFSICILLSGTRKMLIIIIVALLAIPYIYDTRYKIRKMITRTSVILMLIVIGYTAIMNIPVLYNSIGNRIGDIVVFMETGTTNEASFNTRAKLIEMATEAFYERPIYGWGLDNFSKVINNGGYYTHNNFMEILVSSGIVGFVIYYLKYIYVIYLTFKSKKYSESVDYNIIRGLRICLIFLIILEYWQVTYFNRLFMLPFILTLSFSKKELTKQYR